MCDKNMTLRLQLVVLSLLTWYTAPAGGIGVHACFNNVLDIKCAASEMIAFNTARYGRNNTEIAALCRTPFQRNCDVDAHFTLNRLCAGLHKCALVVNTQLFNDPCGYEEFLTVSYNCVPVPSIHRTCQSPGAAPYFDHGYIASPNYPAKYYMDAECTWSLAVQPRQTIRVTIFDFELDVKKGGNCFDYLEIETRGQTVFKDCGALGKQSITVDSSTSLVRFKTGQSSPTQRGFFIYFEAVGPGCPDITISGNGTVVYRMFNGELTANVTCLPGFVFLGSDQVTKTLRCMGSEWSLPLNPCVGFVPTTTALGTTGMTPTGIHVMTSEANDLVKSGSIVGIALGVVSALLLITLLLVLSLYLHRRRKKAERKLDQMRVVFNNLQENAINDDSIQQVMDASLNISGSPNIRKGKRGKKNKNFKDDELQGRNLLSPACYIDDDDYDTPKDIMSDTYMKYPMIVDDTYKSVSSRRPSRAGKHSLCRSRDSYLDGADSAYEWDEYDIRDRARSRGNGRPNRARSGVWDNRSTAAMSMTPKVPKRGGRLVERKQFTQSAPDILELLKAAELGLLLPVHTQYPGEQVVTPERENPYSYAPSEARVIRSSTMGAVQGHRTVQPRPRCNSRGKLGASRNCETPIYYTNRA